MEPRLATSKKWTSLPKEYLQQIQEVFIDKFHNSLQRGQIIIEGRIYPEEFLLRVGYQGFPSTKPDNFEVSIEYDRNKQNMLQLIDKAIDCADSMMHEYFSNNKKIEFPKAWQPFDMEGQKVFLQHSTVNTELETHADRLLDETINYDDLIQGDKDEEDIAVIKAKLGLSHFL